MSPDASLSFRRLALKNWWLGLGRSKKQDAKRKESGNYLLVPRTSAYLAVISDSDFACMIRREGSPGRWRTSKGYFNFRKFAGSPSVGRVTAGCRFFFFLSTNKFLRIDFGLPTSKEGEGRRLSFPRISLGFLIAFLIFS